MSKLSSLSNNFTQELNKTKNYTTLILDQYRDKNITRSGKKIFNSAENILSFEVFRNKKKVFRIVKNLNEMVVENLEIIDGIQLIDTKKYLFSLFFPIEGSSDHLRIIFKVNVINEFVNDSNTDVELLTHSMLETKKLYKKIKQDFISNAITQSTFEFTSKGKEELVTFVSIVDSFVAISKIKKSIALIALDNYYVKIFFVTLLFIGLSLSFSIWIANLLTKPLNLLVSATEKLGEENTYNLIEAQSNDEIGELTDRFNIMSDRLTKLLNKIRMHNVELERTVQIRTQELSSALDLQKAVMDSLEEGIIVLNKDAAVSDIYSKSAAKMFPEIENKAEFATLLGMEESERKITLDVFKNMFKEVIPFKDIKGLAIQKFETTKNSYLEFNYTPVRNSKGKIEKVVIVSSDKTDIKLAEKKALKDKKQAQMIIQIMSRKPIFLSAIEDLKTILSEDSPCQSLQEFFYIVHSIKGIVGQFHMENVVETCHKIEDQIEKNQANQSSESNTTNFIASSTNELKDQLQIFFHQYGHIIGIDSLNDIREVKEIKFSDLLDFKALISNLPQEIQDNFELNFCTIQAEDYFRAIESSLNQAATQSRKKILPLEIISNNISLPIKKYDSLIYAIQHLLRNCIEHGIEDQETRLLSDKNEAGKIIIEIQEGKAQYTFTITDDGKGIKAETDLNLEEMLNKITNDGFSSAESIGNFSGRGVGMGAVKETVEAYNGQLKLVKSSPSGTIFEIQIPKK